MRSLLDAQTKKSGTCKNLDIHVIALRETVRCREAYLENIRNQKIWKQKRLTTENETKHVEIKHYEE